MILSKLDIEEELRKGHLVIRNKRDGGPEFDDVEPGDPRIQQASIDLRLDFRFRRPKVGPQAIILDLVQGLDTDDFYEERAETAIELRPSDFILGWTAEAISVPNHLCGWIEGRSGTARSGLVIHFTAPHIAPGFGLAEPQRIQLEIANLSRFTLRLTPGMGIAQLILMRLASPVNQGYAGRFAEQAP
ncbi:MAG: dCTP deaminase [Actinomycetota bacterium]|nr:dCTP deaminase [Actinomycetota bacterium]